MLSTFFRDHLTIPRLLVLSFLSIILLGSIVLMHPIMRASDAAPLSFVDALFTSASATCVTGLIVQDTPVYFSFFGQLTILILFQVGGIGILTLSTYFLQVAGFRLRIQDQETIRSTHGQIAVVSTKILVKKILLYSFAVEAIGAAFLVTRFSFFHPFGEALWLGIFHSVSAFCNAGFSMFSNSLVGFQDDVTVNLVIMWLIIMGGLGFLVFVDIGHHLRSLWAKKRSRLTLHSRVVLAYSLILIVVGALYFYIVESSNPAQETNSFSMGLRMLFLSVTSRTAGFNTVDLAELTNAGLLFVMFLMIIGASPGSTGGGIKTTTLATLLAVVFSRLRGRPSVEMFNRQISPEIVGKAVATTAGFVLTVGIAILALEWTELNTSPASMVRGKFLEHLFEVISATGTAGLSMGITGGLSDSGKLVIIMCMFFGRLGPLVVGATLIGKKSIQNYKLPNESLMIG